MIFRGLEASGKEERKAAAGLLVSVYKAFDFKKVESIVSTLPKSSLELVHKSIPEAESFLKLKNQ
jgi:hypothetical protein